MKLDEIKARLWPQQGDATPDDVARLVGEKAREFAEKKVKEAEAMFTLAEARAILADETAKMQVASLQKMYTDLLTESYLQIADLNKQLVMKMANVK